MKNEIPKEALLIVVVNSAALQANGNFLRCKEIFVPSCTEQNTVGTCAYDKSSCLLGYQNFCTAKPFPNNLFSILIIQAGYMKSSSMTKKIFCFTTETGIKGITVRTEYEKSMQGNYETETVGCRRKRGERNEMYKTLRGLK